MLRRCPASPHTYSVPRVTPAAVRAPSLAMRAPARPAAPRLSMEALAPRRVSLPVVPCIPRMNLAKSSSSVTPSSVV